MTLSHLFIDMNSYFASAEQQRRYHLRYNPVAVAAVDADSTSCIAASYEAKALGVRTGTPVRDARRLGVRIVIADPPHYVRLHHRIKDAIDTVLPVDIICIDEYTGRLSKPDCTPARAADIARQVKRAIALNVGAFLTCSIGIAPNRFLAKVAADMQKPDGITLLSSDDLPHKLFPLDLLDLPGISHKMLRRLHNHGISTVQHLCSSSEKDLRAVWGGVVGSWWWHWLRGFDLNPKPTRRSSVGHSHVLPPNLRNDPGAYAVLLRLIYKAAARLRSLNHWARHIEIYISYSYREEGWRATLPLGLCQDTPTMTDALSTLWPHRPPGTPTQVAVTLFNLVPSHSATLPLFPEEQRRLRLSQTIDRAKDLHGHNTLYPASLHHHLDSAPTRIAFTQIPSLADLPD
jgi:DNA polymerase-4